MPRHTKSVAGYTLVELMITVGLIGTLAAVAAPLVSNVADGIKLGQAAREVERELQTARLKAVTSNRPIRLRFNCPTVGKYRMVELIGTPSVPLPADTALNRCQESAYAVPANDSNPLTRPNLDGPTRRLPDTVAFGAAATLEFWPDGSVHQQAGAENPWAVVPVAGTAITLTREADVQKITVNGLGKITLVD